MLLRIPLCVTLQAAVFRHRVLNADPWNPLFRVRPGSTVGASAFAAFAVEPQSYGESAPAISLPQMNVSSLVFVPLPSEPHAAVPPVPRHQPATFNRGEQGGGVLPGKITPAARS